MDNPRPEKVAVVDEVRERLSSRRRRPAHRVPGPQGRRAGRRCAAASARPGGDYKIYKNTLVRFAVRDLGLDELEDAAHRPDGHRLRRRRRRRAWPRPCATSPGPTPTSWSRAACSATRLLTADDARALADVPPREVLLAQFAGGLAAPLQQFAGLLQALPRNFAYGLQALIDQQRRRPARPAEAPAAPSPRPLPPRRARRAAAAEAADAPPSRAGEPPTEAARRGAADARADRTDTDRDRRRA